MKIVGDDEGKGIVAFEFLAPGRTSIHTLAWIDVGAAADQDPEGERRRR